ncbi:MAG: alpha-2-macroglobulin family protein [Thermoguttaceae bacterium]
MTRFVLILCAILLCGGVMMITQVASQTDANTPHPVKQAEKKMSEGLPKDALDIVQPWTLDPKNADSVMLQRGVERAILALQNLNRTNEIDAYLESLVAAHKDKPFALSAIADFYRSTNYLSPIPRNGFIIDGEFCRGNDTRGRSGEYVDASERDRVRALQLFRDAAELLPSHDGKYKDNVAEFWSRYSDAWMSGRENMSAWRLQFLTDVDTLPDYEPAQRYWRGGGETSKAPVNADGSPLLYHVPKSLAAAKNDGERWRFCLEESARIFPPNRTYGSIMQRAQFSLSQFGTETLHEYQSWFCSPQSADATGDNAAIWSLASLRDGETIAKLATGIKRFKLDDEFNYIVLFKAAHALQPSNTSTLEYLASIYAARNQFPTAANYWKQLLDQNPNALERKREYWQNQLDQIVGNWGQFQPTESQVAGVGADVAFRFRNGKQVRLTAHEIDIPKLLGDVKAYIKSKPPQLDWNKLQIDNIGWQIVQQNERKYVGREVARWSVDLDPPADHFDALTTITLPTKNAGAYLVRAEMDGGNVDQIVIWVANTVIVKKPLESANNSATLLFVADAETGAPLNDMSLDLLGFQQEHIDGTNRFRMLVDEQTFTTEASGIVAANDLPQNRQWLITAQSKDKKRLAWLGFTGIWSNHRYDETYNQTKAFFISDRPVYRPKDAVHFKFWVGTAKYDLGKVCEWADKDVTLVVHNPKGEEIIRKQVKLDAYGSLTDSYELPADATLGVYAVNIEGIGGGSFRVEEYRKPEYSVTVEAPRDPVALGDAITATIQARYFFGSPVTNATVKYKVTRQKTSADFYPWGPWDWLYGRGYWWFGYDCTWYPGWAKWGCERPVPPWFGRHESGPPEIVAEREVAIGDDGKVQVNIDTALALAMFPNVSQRYTITAEVVDSSRRTEVGTGNVLVAKEPFKVYAWTSRGYYKPADKIEASFQTRRLDGKPVAGDATVTLYKVTYDGEQREDEIVKPREVAMHTEKIVFGDDGKASLSLNAAEAGQYRLACVVKTSDGTADGKTQEGATLLNVFGVDRARSENFAFTALELVPDAAEYAPDETVNLRINTARSGATVLLFAKPANVYLAPQVLRIDGKSVVTQIPVALRDMPNFFVEAITISGGKCYTEVKEIVVPPAKRVLNVDVRPSKDAYKPGESATAILRVTDENDKPVVGQVAVTVYDKSVEVISGGSNVSDIKEFFWKWRRSHYPQTEHTLGRTGSSIPEPGKIPMQQLSPWGMNVVYTNGAVQTRSGMAGGFGGGGGLPRGAMAKGAMMMDAAMPMSAPAPMALGVMMKNESLALGEAAEPMDAMMVDGESGDDSGGTLVEAKVRENFADTAYWSGVLETNENGECEIDIAMPESLTTWKISVWTLALGTRVGEGFAEVVTRKDLMVRLHTPRFLVQGDRATISATIHNYLATAKDVQASLELGDNGALGFARHPRVLGGGLENTPQADAQATFAQANPEASALDARRVRGHDEETQTVNVAASGETRIDWEVVALQEGDGVFTVKGLTNEESDAMKKTIPVFVHGMFKQEAWSRAIRPNETEAEIVARVPEKRRPEATELTVRFSPTLATAMIDALPYLVDFPYGCTEQTLNRFLPTAITQRVLQEMNVDLATLAEKHANLNAQQLGDNSRPVNQRLFKKNPVYSVSEVEKMSADGVKRLSQMQLGDGGFGWFSGYGEHSSPHLTALVVHGLRVARECDIAVEPNVIDRGVAWLKKYEARQIELLNNADFSADERRLRKLDWKERADATDALVLMTLAEFGKPNEKMAEYLWRDRGKLSLYGVSMFGIAISGSDDAASRERVQGCVTILSQYLTQDTENQTAFLNLRGVPNWCWWCWYDSEFETQAYFLKLLVRTNPKNEIAPQLVKYLLNNRAHGTYWSSTRDTAIIVESFAEYLKATGENKPQMTVEVLYDGEVKKTTQITPQNLFTIDNTFALTGEDVTSGEHKIVVRKQGDAPLYVNAYLGNFTLEDPITKTGLEVKVERRIWRLVRREDATAETVGGRGEAHRVAVEKYDRVAFTSEDTIASGDLLEIELIVESKNDYESIIIEDFKAAGTEAVEVQSGYTNNALGAYVEFRDDRVVFFNSLLRQGRHSVTYRLRAETPGKFSALPTKIWGMYAPELKGNSDENKVHVTE